MSFKNASETQNHERPESEFGASQQIPISLVLPQRQ
jgi:hypothetical protein